MVALALLCMYINILFSITNVVQLVKAGGPLAAPYNAVTKVNLEMEALQVFYSVGQYLV